MCNISNKLEISLIGSKDFWGKTTMIFLYFFKEQNNQYACGLLVQILSLLWWESDGWPPRSIKIVVRFSKWNWLIFFWDSILFVQKRARGHKHERAVGNSRGGVAGPSAACGGRQSTRVPVQAAADRATHTMRKHEETFGYDVCGSMWGWETWLYVIQKNEWLIIRCPMV